ncbi:MAG: hypothetical protein HY000_21605 [Planctomycetes bacterium]|nr:hypothetical protein [Planctomycetota bacterium]
MRSAVRPCDSCGMQLPLREARENEKGHGWLCANCGRWTIGVLNENARETIRRNVIDQGEIRRQGTT